MTYSILLCDDELHILRAAELKFKRAGLEVQCASDGQEAWEMIEQQAPDLLITDYQMPRLDGLELTRRIRQTPELAQLPIVMLTAKGFELSTEELRQELEISAMLSKPFSPRELVASVLQILEKRESPQATATS